VEGCRVVPVGGKLVLFKQVSNQWMTEENRLLGTPWAQGEIVTHTQWEPRRSGLQHSDATPLQLRRCKFLDPVVSMNSICFGSCR
jgi:hypothetical protein